MGYPIRDVSACAQKVYESVADISSLLLFSTRHNFDSPYTINENFNILFEALGEDEFIHNYIYSASGQTIDYMRLNAITSSIINFTSTVEYFFKDIIKLCLKRSSKCRQSAFASKEISALKLEKFNHIVDLKFHLIDILASENSKGGLFSDKLKRVSRFLSVDFGFLKVETLNGLDGIWHLRNRIAHEHIRSLNEISIIHKLTELRIDDYASISEFREFIMQLIKLYMDSAHLINEVDCRCRNRWECDIFLEKEIEVFPWSIHLVNREK